MQDLASNHDEKKRLKAVEVDKKIDKFHQLVHYQI